MKKATQVGILFTFLALFILGAALADEPAEGRNGRAELRLLEGMIDHHQMALDMAQDCLSKATSEAVLSVCQEIIEAQSGEISLMQAWLREWYNVDYAPVSMMPLLSEAAATVEPTSGMDHGAMAPTEEPMAGMDHGDMGAEMDDGLYTDPPMTMGMMAGLNRLEGTEYEVAWLESMIDHHDDALHMSERLLPRVQHDELRQLAEQIIDDQTSEIEMMEALLAEYEAE